MGWHLNSSLKSTEISPQYIEGLVLLGLFSWTPKKVLARTIDVAKNMILVGLKDIHLSLSLSPFSLGTSNSLLLFILTFPHLEFEAYLKFMGKTLQETMNIAFYTTVIVSP